MKIRLSAVVVGAVGVGALTSSLAAQPMPIAKRTYGLLASDTNLHALYLLRDLDGNGTATDPGETTVFFDGSNLSGLPAPTGNVFVIAQAIDGSIYFGDGDTDTVYRLRDFN